ncbi:hypothetical protein BN439_2702 [Erwinia amylovora Ea644]|nr:hypothetical protein BN439_2702 [Erwinia amylovora Ea644]CCP07800.1 hypothetical protein BN440_2787 [Erwinia amylovora MR1]
MEWIIGGIILLAIIGSILKPRRCDICGILFKRNYHTWTIEGRKQYLCPNCNSKMSRRLSNQRFTDRFG